MLESKPSDAVTVIQVLNQVYMDCFLFCGCVVFQFKLFVHVFFFLFFLSYVIWVDDQIIEGWMLWFKFDYCNFIAFYYIYLA